MAGEEYRALVAKVEGFVAGVGERRASDLACKRGCDGCCHAWLSVSAVEADAVRSGLAALPDEARARVRQRGQRELAREREQTARREAGDAGEDPPRCALLEDDGSCAVYAVRPLVCRTQGHALRYPPDFVPEAAVRLRTRTGDVTWCPLNYTDAPRAAKTCWMRSAWIRSWHWWASDMQPARAPRSNAPASASWQQKRRTPPAPRAGTCASVSGEFDE